MKVDYVKSSSPSYISASNRKICAENRKSNRKTTTELTKEALIELTCEHNNSHAGALLLEITGMCETIEMKKEKRNPHWKIKLY